MGIGSPPRPIEDYSEAEVNAARELWAVAEEQTTHGNGVAPIVMNWLREIIDSFDGD